MPETPRASTTPKLELNPFNKRDRPVSSSSLSRMRSGLATKSTTFGSHYKKYGQRIETETLSFEADRTTEFPHPQTSSTRETEGHHIRGNSCPPSPSSLTWKDHTTGQVLFIDRESGVSWSNHGQAHDRSIIKRPSTAPAGYISSSIRLKRRNAQRAAQSFKSNESLTHMLRGWKNPVFETCEPVLKSSAIVLPSLLGGRGHSVRGESELKVSRLSVKGLRVARVIAQFDKKFILLEMPSEDGHSLLALLDQHAADERCRIEELMKELCVANDLPDGHQTKLGHSSGIKNTTTLLQEIKFDMDEDEGKLLERHATYFARWGILFDVAWPKDHSNERCRVSVQSLPAGISARCVAQNDVCIDLLRTEAWTAETSGTRPKHDVTASAAPGPEEPHGWLRAMHDCPTGLIELLNSRACRSAIMFNDTLSLQQCTDLVRRLSQCAFPFQCAHARPSIVPVAHF